MGNMFSTLSWTKGLVLIAVLSLGGCSTISGWFTDDEELEIRTLKPIEAQFEAKRIWSQDLSGGVDFYYSRLRPALAYDKVYAASRQGTVAAFDETSGKEIWKRDLATYPNDSWFSFISNIWSSGISAKISGGLTISYETVFFGTEDGEVFALDANTGETKWRVKVRGEVIAPPAVDEQVVVVNTGSGTLFALNATTGEQLWSYDSDVPALSLRGISTPVAVNGGAIVGTATGKLVVNILASGQTAWEETISAPSGATELERIVDIDSEPVVLAGIIYVISFDGTLASVELRTGRIIWKREYNSYRRIGVAGNSLYVTDVNSNMYSIDRRNGVELWSQSALKKRNLTAPEPIGDYVVVGDKYGYLHWMNQSDGQIVARMDIGGDDEDEGIYVEPVTNGNKLYAQTRDGELVAIEVPAL
ncbi:outer membrane protein assembly factor BamB [Aliiglaciecola sp. LCG003]|uniref:outer membrane protein assembly factor BamB n=1 Tax=Aliiglaciecola sp. LCG003 TaxID=3053655 RepID=UPI0025726116|nr:outer membrane protein assembly factor BamB [Aliiglaciecola sp. LCG003]WJG10517.1 outer membrane protein assembly factor BamB [Aliiglaciecola sp. LCG003]